MTSGIYAIINEQNGKKYIGSSRDIKSRWSFHKSALSRGIHHSPILQHAWDKYGRDSFLFVVLEECEIDDLIVFEQRNMDLREPEYNVCKRAGSNSGIVHIVTEDTRRKLRDAHTGVPHTAERRENISKSMKGRPSPLRGTKRPEETKKRMSAAHVGHVVSPETRERISATLRAKANAQC